MTGIGIRVSLALVIGVSAECLGAGRSGRMGAGRLGHRTSRERRGRGRPEIHLPPSRSHRHSGRRCRHAGTRPPLLGRLQRHAGQHAAPGRPRAPRAGGHARHHHARAPGRARHGAAQSSRGRIAPGDVYSTCTAGETPSRWPARSGPRGRTATPAAVPDGRGLAIRFQLDTAALRTALGRPGRVGDGVWQASVPRAELIRLGGTAVPPAMGVATSIGFQPLARSARPSPGISCSSRPR